MELTNEELKLVLDGLYAVLDAPVANGNRKPYLDLIEKIRGN